MINHRLQYPHRTRIESHLGARVRAATPVQRGHSEAGRWIVHLDDGRRYFAKIGVDDVTRAGIETEVATVEALPAAVGPSIVWSSADGYGCLVLDDWSDALWPPPWTASLADLAFATLDIVAGAEPPTGRFGDLVDRRHLLLGWRRLVKSPDPFLDLGVRTRRWLDTHLAALLELEEAAVLAGEQIVHRDLRSDNLCFVQGRCRIIDWAGTEIGNNRFDATSLMISIATDQPDLDLGPHLVDGDRELLTLHTGYLASRAGLPDPYPRSPVRGMQLDQLRGALRLLERWHDTNDENRRNQPR